MTSPTLNIPQYQFLSNPAKFRGFVAGFGSGKTYVGCYGIGAHTAKFPKVDSSYYAPSYKLIKDVFWPTVDEVAFNLGFTTNIKTSDKEVHWWRGGVHYGVTHCRSMDDPSNIVGFKSGHALIDELDIMPTDKAKLAWRKILARMRYKVPGLKNGVDVTTTPEGFKFTYEQFVKEATEHHALIRSSTYDNEANLPDDYISTLLAGYPDQLRDAYINGEFVNLNAGTVYKNYDRKGCDCETVVKTGEPLFIGLDFNVTKMAAVIFVQRDGGKQWHAVDQIKNGYDTPDVIEILNARYKGHEINVYPDASGESRKTNNASTSDLALLRAAKFKVHAKSTNPAIKDRVLSVNSAFHKGVLKVNVSKCPDVADCLEQQVYDDNGMPDKKNGKDHHNDAFGYPIAYAMPIRKPIIKIKSQW